MSFSPVQKHKEEIKAVNVDGKNIEVMCFHEIIKEIPKTKSSRIFRLP